MPGTRNPMSRDHVRPLLVLLMGALTCWNAGAHAQQIETSARHAYMVDFNTGAVLLDKASDVAMPPSSMSKLMTAYMVFERLKEGSLSFNDTLPVSEKAWRMQGSKMFVHVGNRVSVQDLIRGVIIQSGNDACIVLAEGLANSEQAFAEAMNKKAKQIGLTNSNFTNSTGWPDDRHVMTARDLVTLSQRLIVDFPEYYKFYSQIDFTYNNIKQGNRNPLLYKKMGADGLKTGHTDLAGYGLAASVKRGDRRLILVVNGLRSMQERSDETERLIEWGFREFDNYALFKPGQQVTDAAVWLGTQQSIPLIAERTAEITLNRRVRKDMKVTAILDEPVPAPIKKNSVVGKLVVTAPGMNPVEVPLLAGADVEKLGFFSRISAAVSHILWGPPQKVASR